MDYGALPPEINSGRMYAGPGSGPMLAAASGWSTLAAELSTAASAYASVIEALISGPWVGPSATAMAGAVTPYVEWMNETAAQAEIAATQAQAAAGAFESAFAMMVPPPAIAANRAQLMMLMATNFFGQNAAAIAATEAEYAAMWAQDAAAMYGYAANSATATAPVTPFSAAPETTSASGLAAQESATSAAAGAAAGNAQSTLSEVVSGIPGMLQNLSSPLSGASSATPSPAAATGIADILGGFLGTGTGTADATSIFGATGQSLLVNYLYLPGLFGMFMAEAALGPLLNPDTFLPFANLGAAAAAPASGLPPVLGGGFGGLAGLGQAASVGGLSVPPNWGWTAGAVGPGGLPVLTSAAVPLEAGEMASGMGFPMMFGPLGRAAAAGAAAGAVGGAAAAKYGPRLRVLTRSPFAGYSDDSPVSPPPPATPKYPPPTPFPTNGHAPPGYQPAIVYVPVNGHAPSNA